MAQHQNGGDPKRILTTKPSKTITRTHILSPYRSTSDFRYSEMPSAAAAYNSNSLTCLQALTSRLRALGATLLNAIYDIVRTLE